MIRNIVLLITSLALLSSCTHKGDSSKRMAHFEKAADSDIGVSIVHIESGKAVNYNEQERFQMASTVKIPIGIYLMHLAQEKKINLDKMIQVEPGDLVLGSGLMGYFLSRSGLSMSLYNMFEPMIAISDNSATDMILKEIGGPKAVYGFLKSHDLGDIMISRSIEEIYASSGGVKSWPDRKSLTLTKRLELIKAVPEDQKQIAYKAFYEDPRDTTTTAAMSMLVAKLYKGELLDKEYTGLMLDVFAKERFSRVRDVLPKGATLISKTGTWYDNQSKGAQYNYMGETGIITLPGGEHLAFAIYLKSDHSNVAKQKRAIGEVMKWYLSAGCRE